MIEKCHFYDGSLKLFTYSAKYVYTHSNLLDRGTDSLFHVGLHNVKIPIARYYHLFRILYQHIRNKILNTENNYNCFSYLQLFEK